MKKYIFGKTDFPFTAHWLHFITRQITRLLVERSLRLYETNTEKMLIYFTFSHFLLLEAKPYTCLLFLNIVRFFCTAYFNFSSIYCLIKIIFLLNKGNLSSLTASFLLRKHSDLCLLVSSHLSLLKHYDIIFGLRKINFFLWKFVFRRILLSTFLVTVRKLIYK